jgi:hypothetical protein
MIRILQRFKKIIYYKWLSKVREIWCSKPSILIYKSFSHYWFSSLSSNTNINISIKRLESMLAVAIINMKKWSFVFGLLIWKNWSLLSMLNQVRELCPAVFNATFNHISVISWQSNWSHEIQHMLIHTIYLICQNDQNTPKI